MKVTVTNVKMLEYEDGKVSILINGRYVNDDAMKSTLRGWILDAKSRR